MQPLQHLSSLRFDESSIESDEPDPIVVQERFEVSYHICDNVSKRGKAKLFDTAGYEYNFHRRNNAGITWRCSVRNKKEKCGVLVKQKKNKFARVGRQTHLHAPKYGVQKLATGRKKAKLNGLENPFTPASHIVRDTIMNDIGPGDCEALPNFESLVRSINDHRTNQRPKDPKDKNFELEVENIPDDFLLEDLFLNGERHIIFSTKQQLNLLTRAKTWFVDGTFKFVKPPFTQLFSIHAFAKSNDELLQIPLVYCLMSRRQTSDYKAVFQAIVASFQSQPKLRRVVLDFEAAVWNSLKIVFPTAEIRGCSFHFTQAVYRKLQNIGLQCAYQNDKSVRQYLRKLMALCYVPATHIRPLFQALAQQSHAPAFQELLIYMRQTWIESTLFKPENWSVYGLPFRTNNDVEGWHHKINRKTRPNTPFYLLVKVLHEEAVQIPSNIELLNQKKLKRRLRKKYVKQNKKVFDLWKEYASGNKSAKKLLQACSYLVAAYE